jgi:hypothetical protein
MRVLRMFRGFLALQAGAAAGLILRGLARRPARDDILAKQVGRNTAACNTALAIAEGCDRRTAAILAVLAETASLAGRAAPDTDATLPGLTLIDCERIRRASGELCAVLAAVPAGVPPLLPDLAQDGGAVRREDLAFFRGERVVRWRRGRCRSPGVQLVRLAAC